MTGLNGIRSRVVLAVLAVTAVAFSALATIGFVQIANGGRDDIEDRISEVLDDTERSLRSGLPTISLQTADGVEVDVMAGEAMVEERPGRVMVSRTVTMGTDTVLLVGTASEARLTESLRSLYRALWIGIPIAVVISALLAGEATRRALRPVDAITRDAAAIGGRPDGARVPVPGSGDEIERLARTVNEMLDRIDSGHEAQRRFTSDAAHELRTPLMALQGELELVGGRPDQVDTALLERLDALSHRLGARIDDLLLLATLDEGRAPVRQQTDLVELASVECAAISQDVVVSGDPALVEVDPALVSRAIRNLVANACRHAEDTVSVAIERTDDSVVVHVDDDGPGVPVDHRSTMFERFARLDESRSTDTGGSGLGTAIAASVVEAHGGSIEATDSPLGGLRVTLRLPVRPT